MLKIFQPSNMKIKYMHQRDFKWLGGFKVEAFVNGDFKMLDIVMGNQPSANHPRLKH